MLFHSCRCKLSNNCHGWMLNSRATSNQAGSAHTSASLPAQKDSHVCTDVDLLPDGRGASAAAAGGADCLAGATAGGASKVAIRPAGANTVCVAGTLAPRAFRQVAICLFHLQVCSKSRLKDLWYHEVHINKGLDRVDTRNTKVDQDRDSTRVVFR